MGYGDELIASGMARGASARGKRIAFGNGKLILWHSFAYQILWGNPNVAQPGEELEPDLEWIHFHVGSRLYNKDNKTQHKWDFIPGVIKQKGEIFFRPEETNFARQLKAGFILIEPNVPKFKSSAVNKQWPVKRYQKLARALIRDGHHLVQLKVAPPYGPGVVLDEVTQVECPSFRRAVALLAKASLYVGPEGGMHHGAAAVDCPAAVIFGGYISPEITGYAQHANLYAGGPPCGNYNPCEHCTQAMLRISVEEVYQAAQQQLNKELK